MQLIPPRGGGGGGATRLAGIFLQIGANQETIRVNTVSIDSSIDSISGTIRINTITRDTIIVNTIRKDNQKSGHGCDASAALTTCS